MNKNAKSGEVAIFWGKFGVFITIGCFIFGLIGGSLYTRWVADDTQEEYLKTMLSNAISEIDYNLSVAWYNDTKFIDTDNYYSSLRTQSLWQVYYNCGKIYGNDSSVTNQIKKCLDEIDWVNRLVPAQYSKDIMIHMLTVSDDNLTIDKVENFMENKLLPFMSSLHQSMYDKYQASAQHKMREVRTYLLNKLDEM